MFSRIKTVVTDVDGVLTDGTFTYTEEGKVAKQFGPHDSEGVRMLRAAGIEVRAVTADWRGLKITRARLRDMGVEVEIVSEEDRAVWFRKNFDPDTTAFVGDGYSDAAVMAETNYGFAPANAVLETYAAADFGLYAAGGQGVLLEVALLILGKREYCA